ncbi:MAG: Npt1/Npt2 family nucleotide transporter, partial [Anaerolineales bacterium]|nr:Npt1/Npt2 family nucleotide transporter [Anaerolineales bacterium]
MNSTRVQELFKIRPGEGRMVLLITGAMLATTMGAAIGTPGADALFFTRFGVEFLPFMYLALGLVTMATTLMVTGLLGRLPRRNFYLATPVILAVGFIVARLILAFDMLWFYPVLWLAVSITWTLQALFTWGTAGSVCDTRQAKRLFPLFGAGGILGIALGGLLTGPISRLIPAENLILFWSAGLLVAALFGWLLLRGPRLGHPGASAVAARRQQLSILTEMRQGFNVVRASHLLRWLSIGSILFGILFYSVVFPFSAAASAQFPDENNLSGFLGVFMGLATLVAFLVSILLANRLYARFGVMNMILGYSILYTVGFLALSGAGSFGLLVAVRFSLIIWYQGVASSAYQAIFNIVPPERRDQTRAFINGVPEQLGVILAGVILILSERILTADQLFILGAGIAIVAAYVAWRGSKAYRLALMDALKAGQHQFFYSEEEQFGGFPRDAAAMAVVVDGINHPDPVVRRVSAEILGHIPMPEVRDAMVEALDDEDPQVRASLLRSLALSDSTPALLDVLACLDDPDGPVRREALLALQKLAGYPRGLTLQVLPMLEDEDTSVRSAAAGVLLDMGEVDIAQATIQEMLESPEDLTRMEAYQAMRHWHEGNPVIKGLLVQGLDDPSNSVRRAAALSLAESAGQDVLVPLVHLLGDEDPTVRGAAARALGEIGEPAVEPVLDALSHPQTEDGALLALEGLSVGDERERIVAYARSGIEDADRYFNMGGELSLNGSSDRIALLRDSLDRKARLSGINSLRALQLISDRAAISIALKNLDSRDPNQRANAIEILETIDESGLVSPLLPIWEGTPAGFAGGGRWLLKLLDDPDAWLRA